MTDFSNLLRHYRQHFAINHLGVTGSRNHGGKLHYEQSIGRCALRSLNDCELGRNGAVLVMDGPVPGLYKLIGTSKQMGWSDWANCTMSQLSQSKRLCTYTEFRRVGVYPASLLNHGRSKSAKGGESYRVKRFGIRRELPETEIFSLVK